MKKHFQKKFRFRNDAYEYDFKIRRYDWLWWLLLLLIILVLFIRFNKTITVSCLDDDSNEPISYTSALLEYKDYTIFNNGEWFSSDRVVRRAMTDSCGKVDFDNLKCGVYGLIFHARSRSNIYIENECYSLEPKSFNFHYSFNKTVHFPPRREGLHILLLDDETSDPLPDATLSFEYMENDLVVRDSVKADATGLATIKHMRYCGVLPLLQGRCYGYADTSLVDIPCRDIVVASDRMALRLRPIKDRFTFFVKNKETGQPIPDATCKVSLVHPGSSHNTVCRDVRTSVDGKGIAVYDDAFVLSTITIIVKKQHFKDGKLEGGPWTVEKFIRQDDDTRTIWLEPDPYQVEFQNIDSLNLMPIPGVVNTITVFHADGTNDVYTETSNTNGVFPVVAKGNERLHVSSQKASEYFDKETDYPLFEEIADYKIKMMPILETLSFQTVFSDDRTVLVPDCTLDIMGSISGHLDPDNSGTGSFEVTMRKAERLTIVSSKAKCKTNNTTIRDRDFTFLTESSYNRDIPMELDLPPCNAGVAQAYSQNGVSTRSYSMGKMTGNAEIWVDFYSIGDYLTVYDGPSATGTPIINRRFIENDALIPFSFTAGAVTVVVESGDGSSGKYEVRCPR